MATSIACLCGGIALSVALDPSANHTQLQVCHCTSCRTVTGVLGVSYYLMQHEPPSFDGLQEYQQSPHVSRFFCSTCGTHVFAQAKPSGRYLVASGVLAEEDTIPVESVEHWKVDETGDGGLSTILRGRPSTTTSCRVEALSEQLHNAGAYAPRASMDTSLYRQNELQVRCHCGGISFYITPPDASSLKAHSQWPDLLVPYHSTPPGNPEDENWWLQDNNTRYLAGICVCNSCRLGSGFPIQAWAFIPRSNIFHADRSPLTFKHKNLKQYVSSPGVYREFCDRCGANVFWHNDGRPTLIDVSVGLLREKSAKVEEWLKWASERISFSEMAVQKDLVHLLEEGLRVQRAQSKT